MECTVSALTLYVLLLISALYIYKLLISRTWKPSGKIIPGPRTLPVIGNLHILNLTRPNETYMELSKKYGPIFSIQMGSLKAVVLSGYETVKSALVDYAEEFADRPQIPIFEDIHFGCGLPFTNGDNWKAMRRFTLTTLRDFGMGKRTIEDRIVEECGYMIKQFESFEGKPTDLTIKTSVAIGNIIISIVRGQRFEYQNPTLLKIMKLIDENMRLLGSPSVMLYNSLSVFRYLPGAHTKIKRNIAELHAFLSEEFLDHLEGLDRDDQRGFIDAFLVRQEEEKNDLKTNTYFHKLNLLTVITSLFMAGTETTASTIRWGISLMIQYPEMQKRVHAEIDKVIGSAQPRFEHRKNMPYTNAVIHETQRFANVLPTNLPRAATKDVIFQGYHLPKGTYVIPLLESVLYDKTQFERAESFYPEHFLDAEGKFVKNAGFMPFSAGKRACIGETLAKMELFLFFTSLMQRFTFRSSPDETDFEVKPYMGLTVPPVSRKICCLPRH